LQQSGEETLGSRAVSPLLHQDTKNHSVLVHSAPKITQNAANAGERLIQAPRVSRPRTTFAKPSGEVGAEFRAPEPNAFVAHNDTALGEVQFDIAQLRLNT
jgi:hypothetical protein